MKWHRLLVGICAHVIIALLVCEYAVHFAFLWSCEFPELEASTSEPHVRLLVFGDAHLIGTRTGARIDRLRREWAMERCALAWRVLFGCMNDGPILRAALCKLRCISSRPTQYCFLVILWTRGNGAPPRNGTTMPSAWRVFSVDLRIHLCMPSSAIMTLAFIMLW